MRAGFMHYAAMLDDGKVNRKAFDQKLTMPVLVLNAGLGIPQEQDAWRRHPGVRAR